MASLPALVACQSQASTLTPAGPRADAAIWLHWVMFGLGSAVMAIVLGLLLWAILRRPSPDSRGQGGLLVVVLGGIVLPLVMLPVVWAMTIGVMASEARPDREPVATIEVVARQWSYEVRCPGLSEPLIDEIHIPVGEPVRIRVTSDDVIHSFWVPQLAGKQDMVPGEWHEIWITASEPGVYIGQCGEYCGLHHADHRFTLYAGDAGDCGEGAAAAASCCG